MPEIVVSLYTFTLEDPFAEGHRLTAIEANVLNYVRANLIRKIVVKWVKAAEDASPEGILTLPALEDMERRVIDLDCTYQLAFRDPPKPSAFEQQLSLIAYQKVSKMGLLTDEQYYAQMARIKSLPETREEAHKLLVDKTRRTGRLEDLL